MSLIVSNYDEENKIDFCFYESSNILYSECYDKKDEYKDLKVVFKNGSTYMYKSIPVQNYLLFRENESQGKALNKYIAFKVEGKYKFEYEKLDNTDLLLIENKKNLLLEEKK